MKKIFIATLLTAFATLITLAWLSHSSAGKKDMGEHCQKKSIHLIPASVYMKLHAKATEANFFVRDKAYNSTVCFLIDMSLPSHQNRFFIYDLQRDSVWKAGLVTHGRCNKQWLEGRKYSNNVGGGCTSLGRYKIGNAYMGKFGLAYKLYGLDSSNSNAFKRFVVLHAHECVPNQETNSEICQSDGCPTVSPSFLLQLKSIINKSNKPVLLWVYN